MLQHYAARNMVDSVYNALVCIAVRTIFGRFVVASNLLFVGDALCENKATLVTFVYVEWFACRKVIVAGKLGNNFIAVA